MCVCHTQPQGFPKLGLSQQIDPESEASLASLICFSLFSSLPSVKEVTRMKVLVPHPSPLQGVLSEQWRFLAGQFGCCAAVWTGSVDAAPWRAEERRPCGQPGRAAACASLPGLPALGVPTPPQGCPWQWLLPVALCQPRHADLGTNPCWRRSPAPAARAGDAAALVCVVLNNSLFIAALW